MRTDKLDKLYYVCKRWNISLNLRKWKIGWYRQYTCKYMGAYSRTVAKNRTFELLGRWDNISDKLTDEDKNALLKQADKAISRKIDVLGLIDIDFSNLNWCIDYKSNYVWPNHTYYINYLFIDKNVNFDVKIPWEISRFQHLLPVGEVYLLTKNEKYAREIIEQLSSWIETNPFMYSINWTCSMEVAIRAVNWLYLWTMICDSSLLTESFTKSVVSCLYQHMIFVYHNLEISVDGNNNHYAADIVGLLYLGRLFYDDKRGCRIYQFALKEYYDMLRSQFLPSGFNYERSIPYHRLMTELATYPYFMLQRIGEIIPLDIHYIVRNIYQVICDYSKPSGYAPNIADGDNGRFLPFLSYGFSDHSYLSKLYKIYLGEDCHNTIDSFFLIQGINAFSFLSPLDVSDKLSKSYDMGIALVKNENIYLLVSNTGISKYPFRIYSNCNTHTHSDLLSFELFVNGRDLIIDTGTYEYTRDFEDRINNRSTAMHNTIQVDNIEQYESNNSINGLFSFCNTSIPYPIVVEECQNVIEIKGSYSRYIENNSMIHKRIFKLNQSDRTLLIEDYISIKGNHVASLSFHLDPSVNATMNNNNILLSRDVQEYCGIVSFDTSLDYCIQIQDGYVYPSYGRKVANKVIRTKVDFIDKLTFSTKIIY